MMIMSTFKRILNKDVHSHPLPLMAEKAEIPKIIHQTFQSKVLPAEFQANVDQLRALNPEWQYNLYDDADIEHFISQEYGSYVLNYYKRINPRYGAAKADLFRYLLLYRYGGVYLDIKSTCSRPIDEILQPGDRYLLAGWKNKPGEKHAGWGRPKELNAIARGELQQWHIVCVPGHPFLKAVINAVLTNIDRYNPWLHGTGGNGVLRLTGPIAYTLAIDPLMPHHPHRLAYSEDDFSLSYSALKNISHKPLFKAHYTTLTESIINLRGIAKGSAQIYSFVKQNKKRLLRG